MSTRPRTPAPATPAPGKLPLPELAEMKRRGDQIVMITAYDAPAARIADEAGVELILVGDTAAMVMLGHESTVPVTLDEMIFLTRAVTRAARRPLVVGDLPFGSYEVSDEQAVCERDPDGEGGRRRRRQARGRRTDGRPGAGDRRLEHRRHGPRRPDAAVGDEARRLQGAGPNRRCGGALSRRRARAAGGGRVRGRARGGPGPGRGPRHGGARRADDRDRRGRGDRRPGARLARHARHVRRPRPRASSSSTPSSRRRSATRVGRVRRRGAQRRVPARTSTPTGSRRPSCRAVRGRAGRGERRAATAERTWNPTATAAGTPSAQRGRRSGTRPRPAVDGAHADHQQRERPARNTARAARTAALAVPASLPPVRKTSSPKSASLTGHRTSESAIGTAANASRCRERR